MKNKYIAVYNESAFSGVGIIGFENGIENYCINEYFGPNGEKKTKNKIYTDKEGRNYIKKYNKKYYIDEFLRINI